MIGVIADHGERPAVEEFFELFKTPWEFARRGHRYEAVLIASDTEPDMDAPVVLVYGSRASGMDRQAGFRMGGERDGSCLNWGNRRLPVYGQAAAVESSGSSVVEFDSTGEVACARVTAPGRTIFRFGFDLFREVEYLLRSGQPVRHSHIPTLDSHINLLRACLVSSGVPLVEIPPFPPGHRLIACLTHDVDFVGIRRHRLDSTMFGFLYRATVGSVGRAVRGELPWRKLLENWKAAASLPGIYLGLQEDFLKQFDRYAELEEGLPSTYFLVPFKHTPGLDRDGRPAKGRAVKYDAGDIPGEVARLCTRGAEIGLHGIDAWRDKARAAEERERVARCTGQSSLGIRMHWLYFSAEAPAILEKTGFTYDSTVGYNEAVGFRAGTSQVYRLPGTRLPELPLLVMDTALLTRGRMGLSEAAAFERMCEVCACVSSNGGAFTVNWHHRSVGPERFWDDLYVRLIAELRACGAWFATAQGAVAWFEKRRSVRFRDVEHQGGRLRIRLECPSGDELPGVVLRVHHSSLGADDVAVNGDLEMEMERGV